MKLSKDKGLCILCTSEEYLKDYVHLTDLLNRWYSNWDNDRFTQLYYKVMKEYFHDGIRFKLHEYNEFFVCENCLLTTLDYYCV